MDAPSKGSTTFSFGRVLALLFAILFTTLSLGFLYSMISERRVHSVVLLLFYLLAAAVCWTIALRTNDAPTDILLESGVAWALGLGLPALAVGFYAPNLFGIGGNAAPLFGIVFTGPLGALIGGFVGVVRALPKYRAASLATRRP